MHASRAEVGQAINAALCMSADAENTDERIRNASFLLRLESVMHVRPEVRMHFINEMIDFFVTVEVEAMAIHATWSDADRAAYADRKLGEVRRLVSKLGLSLE